MSATDLTSPPATPTEGDVETGWLGGQRATLASAIRVAIALIIILGIWSFAASRTQQYILPSPYSIAKEMWQNSSLYINAAGPTALEAALGFFAGTIIAVIAAVLFVFSKSLRQGLYPLAVAINSVPIVAITPLLVISLGNGLLTKVVITTLISYFPTLISMTIGLNAVEPEAIEYFRTLRAGRWRTLVLLRWPASLPNLFIGLRIAASATVISAVIAEWVSADKGLGYLIILASRNFSILVMWAGVVSATILALLFFSAVLGVERLALRGRPTT
jgi:NitT/TauT family transport system permease protein